MAIPAGLRTVGRTALGVALGLALAWSITARPAAAFEPVVAPHAESAAVDGPALWVVSDADSTLYLFGTVHLLKPGMDWRTPAVEAALDASEAIWLEIADPNDPAAAALIPRYGLSQTPLSSRLTAAERAQLERAASTLGASTAALDPLQPWLAALQVSMGAIVRAGYDPASGVDTQIKAAADAAGKPVRGLETIEQQIRFFADLPDELQLAFLRQSLHEFDEAATQIDAMVEAWARGDAAAFEAVTIEEFRTLYPELYEVVLKQRNADWAEQIQTLLEGEGTAFMAVGALHLAGDDSVIRMLADRGVTVTRR